jgi:MoxR-like ATPase
MKVRKVRGVLTLPEVLAALEQLGDEELHAVIARAQGLLLDRPAERGETPMLAVEVVAREESHLLAAYRALAPLAQRRVLSHVVRLVRAPRRMGQQLKPATAPPPAVTATAPPVAVGSALVSRSRPTVAS